jgi:HPt (histidine-containing phosphotransfer) domain-containing protein
MKKTGRAQIGSVTPAEARVALPASGCPSSASFRRPISNSEHTTGDRSSGAVSLGEIAGRLLHAGGHPATAASCVAGFVSSPSVAFSFSKCKARADESDRGRIVADNPIDETVLDQLRFLQKEGKPNFPAMIVGLFLDTTPGVLTELEAAAQVGDVSALRMASHKLISASEIVGASALSACCKELEITTRTGSVPDAAERVRAIVEEYNRAEAALRSWRTPRS